MLDRSGFARSVGGDAVPDAGGASRLRRVTVYRDPAEAAEIWDELESIAPVSPYQSRRWLEPWLETTGRSAGVSPFIVVGFDREDRPIALLPFGTWRQGLLTVAGFLGGRDSNFNMGLFKPGIAWSPAMVLKLLRMASRAGHSGVAAFMLRNQPHQWEGVGNPFLLLPHQPSPSFGYKVALVLDGAEFTRLNLSSANRKKLRHKVTRLQAVGPIRHAIAASPQEGRAILDAFVEQRLSRCAALGLGAADLPDLHAFLTHASVVSKTDPPVELHALYGGDRILATFGGTSHRDRYCGMVMSFDSDPDVARFSPGEILLERLIRSKCAEGFAHFDLGIGEARYKETYCPEIEPLFDSVLPVSNRGRLLSAVERLRLRLKRGVKQSDRFWAVVRAARKAARRLGGRR